MAEITPTFTLASTNVVNLTDFNSFRPAKYIVSLSGSVDFLQVFLDGIEHKFPTDVKNFVLDCRNYKKCMVYSEGTGAVTFTEVGEATNPFFNLSSYSGTWTAVEANVTLDSKSCTYTVIGNLVFITALLIWPATADGNNASISGAPFSPAPLEGTFPYSFLVSYNSLSADLVVVMTDSDGLLIVKDSSSGTARTNAQLSGKAITITGFYRMI